MAHETTREPARWVPGRFLAAAVLGGVALGVMGSAPGSAAVAAKYSASDCQAVLGLDDEIPDVDPTGKGFDAGAFRAAAVGFRETAKEVRDKKLKSALNTLAGVYQDMGKAKTAAGALGVTVRAGKKYGKATGVWVKATVECATSSITTPTLPGNVTVPSLPGNVTIPSIPSR